jgi:hypothetical protein
VFLAAALLVLLGAPARAQAQEWTPNTAPPPAYPPQGWAPPPRLVPASVYRNVSTVNGTLVTASAVTFGISYLAAVGFGGLVYLFNESDDDEVMPSGELLFVPVVGPMLITKDWSSGQADGLRATLIADSLIQGAGVGMFIAGLALRTQSVVRADELSARPAPELFVGPGSFGMRLRF